MRIKTKEYEQYLEDMRLRLGLLSIDELSEEIGFSPTTLRTHIKRGIIGEQSFDRLREAEIEPLMFQADFPKQLSLVEADVIKEKNLNRKEADEEVTIHVKGEAAYLINKYKDLAKKSLGEIGSNLIKTHIPGMIQMKNNEIYTGKTHRELVDGHIKKDRIIEEKDRRIEELEKALKDKNGGAE